MPRPTLLEPIELFRLRRSGLIALLAVVLLLCFGHVHAAIGIAIGVALSAGNLFLLYEAGRSLLSTSSGGPGRAVAAGSSVARLLMMGVALWLVFSLLGREALLGSCGGLFLAQVNLRFPLRRVEGVV